jgi:hypothetical protein
MKQVEIFKTQVRHTRQAAQICAKLKAILPNAKINFDLDDCDKILRVESLYIDTDRIVILMKDLGFPCALITD